MHIVWVTAGLFVLCGLAGPKYGGLLEVVALIVARGAVLLACVLWLLIELIRKRTPGFSLREIVSVSARWKDNSPVARAGYTALFVAAAVMSACLGALFGAIGVYLVWRIT